MAKINIENSYLRTHSLLDLCGALISTLFMINDRPPWFCCISVAMIPLDPGEYRMVLAFSLILRCDHF